MTFSINSIIKACDFGNTIKPICSLLTFVGCWSLILLITFLHERMDLIIVQTIANQSGQQFSMKTYEIVAIDILMVVILFIFQRFNRSKYIVVLEKMQKEQTFTETQEYCTFANCVVLFLDKMNI